MKLSLESPKGEPSFFLLSNVIADNLYSRFMSTETLQNDPVGQAMYRTAIVEIIGFAIEKLNDKAVYANTLVFSGRVLGTSSLSLIQSDS